MVAEKRILIIFRKAPYGSGYTAEGLRTALGLIAFEANLGVALVDDGVYWAVPGQNPAFFGMRSLHQSLEVLREEIEEIFIERTSVAERGFSLDDMAPGLKSITRDDLDSLFRRYDVVIPF